MSRDCVYFAVNPGYHLAMYHIASSSLLVYSLSPAWDCSALAGIISLTPQREHPRVAWGLSRSLVRCAKHYQHDKTSAATGKLRYNSAVVVGQFTVSSFSDRVEVLFPSIAQSWVSIYRDGQIHGKQVSRI